MFRRLLYIFSFFTLNLTAQSGLNKFLTPSDTLNKSRRNAVIISEASLAGISLLALDQLWYADFERSKFHTINDNNDWLQMDKIGHVFTAYQMGRIGADLLNWSGVKKEHQLLYGATLGFGYLTAVEIMDGHSKEWGFSWGDMLANASGTALYVSQELLWQEQRIVLKFSFHETNFSDIYPEKLGESILEQLLKDYNGQTYWLSLNVRSFFKGIKIPRWFNVAFGYGGEGMLGNFNSKQDIEYQNFISKNEHRQFYLSLDLNLTSIDTKSRFMSTLFGLINMIKIPFPTLEFSKKGVAFHLFYY